MEKLIYDQSQKPYLINGVQLQIEAAKEQLVKLYAILAQLDSSLVDDNYLPPAVQPNNIKEKISKRAYAPRDAKDGDKDYFIKVKEVLELEGNPLTSRDILKRIYEYYPNEFDENEDRKNIASLSAILTEKTAEGKILRTKPEVGHAVFSFPAKNKIEDKNVEESIDNAPDDDIDWLFTEQTQKVDPDEDDLPF
ncbi:MAG TPA: hypothetical protein VIJ27_01700 [Mucilaginibacter sp.]